ncbi:hypothetical protein IPJ72_00895 [Candidatus Peregrinibacteria bacterium]|nr:MAG: hypothetical protein IPJ72_00895 [Candidatus Peregrinibacteria bacterium]
MQAAKIPETLVPYLCDVSEAQFLKDLMSTFKLVKHLEEKNSRMGVNRRFSEALAEYLMNEVATLLDRLPMSFYGMTVEQKQHYLKKANLPAIFVHVLSTNTYQQNFESLFQYIRLVHPETPYIVIQMARDTEAETKQAIRKQFKKSSKTSFLFFKSANICTADLNYS